MTLLLCKNSFNAESNTAKDDAIIEEAEQDLTNNNAKSFNVELYTAKDDYRASYNKW